MNKSFLYTVLGIALVLSSCSEDEGPKDTPMSFEIPVINQTVEYPVGVFYRNPGTNGQDATRYDRMIEAWSDEDKTTGPGLVPVLGNFGVNQNFDNVTDEMIANLQQQVDWSIDGGIDFWILPAVRAKQNTAAPECIDGDNRLYDIIRGAAGSDVSGSGKRVDMKSLKFAATVNIEDPLCKNTWLTYDENGNDLGVKTKTLAYNVLLDDNDDIVSRIVDEDGGIVKLLRRSEVFAELFNSLDVFFKDSHYFRVNGKPLVVLQNAHKLYSADCKAFYANLRAKVKEVTGEDIYIVAQQEGSWNPPARVEYFFQGVDAITNKNMYNQGNWSRSVDYPRMIYLNWEYNREYFLSNWNVDFIPTGAVAFNGYVDNGNTDKPIVFHDTETFSTMCNVMKSQAGRDRIVFIDSFNDYQYCSFLEPTIEDDSHPNGFGTKMLEVVKKEFDVR